LINLNKELNTENGNPESPNANASQATTASNTPATPMTLNKDKHFVFETPDLECPEEVPKTGKRLNWEADEEREQNPQDKESKVLKRKCISAFSL